ncbi:unnamed protein product [Rotaria socialis]|uniref:Uncharacterized protein n=3 Tax=Rotaria socialis TaxID=392032 RepID=A0A817ZM84_9BILA|nr:unnamed protein product [Rotaria socialis]
MAEFTFLPISNELLTDTQYGDEEFVEVHLDERFYIGDKMQVHKVWKTNNNQMIVQKDYKLFYDPDQCINFVTSYEWRKIFLSLTDKFSYMLPLIHDLPQIVYIYIYSSASEKVPYSSSRYPKLRAIVNESSADADGQLLKDIQTFRQDLMPINVINPVHRKTKLLIQEPSQIERYSVVWIQDNSSIEKFDTSSITDVIDCLEVFFNFEKCMDYIKTSSDDTRIFFISSSSDTETILKEVSPLSKVIAIYLFDNLKQITITPKESIAKVHGPYSDLQSLSNQLSQEYKRYKSDSHMSVSIFSREKNEKTVRDLNKENSRFLWLQLLVDILIKIPYNDQTKDEMLHECKIAYKDDKPGQKAIEEFDKNYKSSEALLVYTQDSFLYRLFNQALRTENIDFLFIFRFFLADMYNQLQQLHSEQFSINPNYTGKTLILYRGQNMKLSEFSHIKDNVGGLLSVNTFFSTTEDFQIAMLYSGFDDKDRPPELISVVFEIEIDLIHPVTKKPFASIAHLRKIPDEREVLFSVGSIFRIFNAEYIGTSEGYWHVKMKLVDNGDDLNELRNELESQYCHNSHMCNLGSALIAMGDYKRAERYFRMLLEYLSERHSSIGPIYGSLGLICSKKGNYQEALESYEQALKYLTRIKINDERENISQIYAHIATAYHGLGKPDLALKYLSMATDTDSSPDSLSYIYNQTAMTYRDQGDYCAALEYFQKTLHIEEEILKRSNYHPLLATMYNNIGEIYIRLGDDENGFKHLQRALDIRLKGTVSTHTDLAAIYNNLGLIYSRKNELKKALEMFEKALEIDTQTFDGNHESLALSHNNIATIYQQAANLSKALYHAETGLRIFHRSQARDNASLLVPHQCNLASIQYELGNNSKALNMAQKALKNQLGYLPESHESISETYHLLSKICIQKGDLPNALEYLEKSVDIARISILPKNKFKFEGLELELELLKKNGFNSGRTLSHMQCAPDQPDLQDRCIRQSIEKLELTSTDNILERINSLNTLISVNSRQGNFQMAMKYFEDATLLYTQNRSSDMLLQQKVEESMVSIFFSGSRVYYRQNNWTMSLEILKKSLDFALKQEQNSLLPEIYNAMGLSFAHQFDNCMAIHYFELAVNTAKKTLPDDHPNLQRYRYQLQQLKP